MKTPISYYGGKQSLSNIILTIIPEHKIYCEPFFGGGAIFFAKEPSAVEIINDTNRELINFYKVARDEFPALEHEISLSLHSRDMHRQAQVIYANPDMFDSVKRAWALWILANSSYGNKLDGCFGYDRTGGTSLKLDNKRNSFTSEYERRLEKVQIENCDAIRVITSRDTDETFFYIDPPYVGAYQGHYDGYMQEDFDNLLSTLEAIKGKFLLSSYRNEKLQECVKRNGWHCQELKMYCSMTSNAKKTHSKVEVLTANFPFAISVKQDKKDVITN